MHNVRLQAKTEGDYAVISFVKGEAQVLLRFLNTEEADRDAVANDLEVLVDNIHELIDSANLEIEAALVRREMADE